MTYEPLWQSVRRIWLCEGLIDASSRVGMQICSSSIHGLHQRDQELEFRPKRVKVGCNEMFGSLRKPLNRTIGIFVLLALGYWAFDLVILGPAIEHRLPWAVTNEKALLWIGQWIPNLHNHLPKIVEVFGIEGALRYARILTSTTISVIAALIFYAATWSWRPSERLEWVPSRSIGFIERHRAISGIAAVAMTYMLVFGVNPRGSTNGAGILFAATDDPIRMLLSPITTGLLLTLFIANAVEQTHYIRRYEKLHSDHDSRPNF
ncbi:hypothetical protein [Dongia rigui]|uniref:Uncharacterized protein n=1 Tax=Dongia rigui TaxID=940149 RepID=A0ABU5DY67_9PROT|nr:hypothetical protein [Dongia rigui]MDY0872220.1 hypothetical protein [Dongia rigui]